VAAQGCAPYSASIAMHRRPAAEGAPHDTQELTVRIAVAVVALLSTSLLGAYALQSRQMEREIANLPLVQMDPVVVIADRAQSAKAGATQVAKNPATTSLR